MSETVGNVIKIIEERFPPSLAETWDNVGLQAGDPDVRIDKMLVALDPTEEVIQEAQSRGIGLILSHHPLIFKPLSTLREDRPAGCLMASLIRRGIALYAAHTNLDSGQNGVNDLLTRLMGLIDPEVLSPSAEKLFKLVVFVPQTHLDPVREAVCKNGAGWIGNYSDCTFSLRGQGTFLPLQGSQPFIGAPGELARVDECRLETIVPSHLLTAVLQAIKESHPYEEPAYDIYPLAGPKGPWGLGRVGDLPQPVNLEEFAGRVKNVLQVSPVKIAGDPQMLISRVAVCGGAGASLIAEAWKKGAQCLVTGDLKYHEARDAAAIGLSVIDAGHFATEHGVLGLLANDLRREFSVRGFDIDVFTSAVEKEPWIYY